MKEEMVTMVVVPGIVFFLQILFLPSLLFHIVRPTVEHHQPLDLADGASRLTMTITIMHRSPCDDV